jgi:hypothetical protein
MAQDPKILKVLYSTLMDMLKKMEVKERMDLLERILGTYCSCGEKITKLQCPMCDFYREKEQ